MKCLIVFLWSLFLIGCGGGNSEDSNLSLSNEDPALENVPLVEIREASNGCIMGVNSEDTMYLQSGGYKSDVWSCAEYDYHASKRIEVLSKYSSVDGCYKKLYVSISDGSCEGVQLYPDEPEEALMITAWSPISFNWSVSNPKDMTYSYDIGIKNTGSITAWALYYEFWIDDVLIRTYQFKQSYGNSIIPGEEVLESSRADLSSGFSCSSGETSRLCPLMDGKNFEAKLVIKDLFGNVLGEALSRISYSHSPGPYY